jgi:hypothetical protein
MCEMKQSTAITSLQQDAGRSRQLNARCRINARLIDNLISQPRKCPRFVIAHMCMAGTISHSHHADRIRRGKRYMRILIS